MAQAINLVGREFYRGTGSTAITSWSVRRTALFCLLACGTFWALAGFAFFSVF